VRIRPVSVEAGLYESGMPGIFGEEQFDFAPKRLVARALVAQEPLPKLRR
jgi:hypothetical protein